ncbi:nucleoside deaminase [Desulfurivibrio alkaliphilus]|uniref:Guanine deaminase n=1 Tax=Desulfurivibrio alkaliphilus (strain DSM 19089 / UNIQEM U267 / AHT2) TaxID=589865 RepID=D6Z718_DESAT|nr:nucleoside deaminase [Desulfurivibrio alkaliphilus]ADH87005.1 Guanine deaminase [Desulfurivibrio alkaliphilus AHT 2]
MEHEKFIAATIALAGETMRRGDGGPFAALVVRDHEIIGRGWNRVTSANDPTAHAEVEAIRAACAQVGDFSLAGCTLYVNCEPCPMCLAAAYWAGIEQIYYAADRHDAAAIGFADLHIYEELTRPPAKRSIPTRQLLRDKALPLFKEWQEMPDKILY